jgi:hypothetical protein
MMHLARLGGFGERGGAIRQASVGSGIFEFLRENAAQGCGIAMFE